MELMDAEDYIRERRAELVNECGDQKRCGRVQEAEVQRVKQPDVLLPRRHIHTYAQCQKQISYTCHKRPAWREAKCRGCKAGSERYGHSGAICSILQHLSIQLLS
ncbi:hypothetical protein MHYP_G00065370 [Metynnis hypsauchen]